MEYEPQIVAAAAAYQLDELMVGGLIAIESAFDPFAWNPEPRYRYYWDVGRKTPFRALSDAEVASKVPPPDFKCYAGDPDQEWWAQSASWGLMQVMGAVAREQGFTCAYLTQLCDPEKNLQVGCSHLSDLVAWARGDLFQAIAAYNGGKGGNTVKPFRNALYASRVVNAWDKLRRGK